MRPVRRLGRATAEPRVTVVAGNVFGCLDHDASVGATGPGLRCNQLQNSEAQATHEISVDKSVGHTPLPGCPISIHINVTEYVVCLGAEMLNSKLNRSVL
jgi:hypothetical protein